MVFNDSDIDVAEVHPPFKDVLVEASVVPQAFYFSSYGFYIPPILRNVFIRGILFVWCRATAHEASRHTISLCRLPRNLVHRPYSMRRRPLYGDLRSSGVASFMTRLRSSILTYCELEGVSVSTPCSV
ncbi:hypothetical protein Salat_1855600 [Sesamum alatum]|uniref:Uncharacterized protein n=1 Tax=Sesamum alatum TaxID=300844 RepID=A0AAE1Y3W0_9LAMI|nr:hypothetical protein Salat_1855600 [Sesamum alatum]